MRMAYEETILLDSAKSREELLGKMVILLQRKWPPIQFIRIYQREGKYRIDIGLCHKVHGPKKTQIHRR